MKLLVTGASGLLGSKLIQFATIKDYKVYSAYHHNTPREGTLLQFDLADKKSLKRIFEKAEPDIVIHAAALTDVDKCETQRELAQKVNVQGSENIAKLCKKHQTYLIYVSTDYVFDGENGNYKETDTPSPINYYGATKLQAEKHIKKLVKCYCIARTSVLYGSTPSQGKTNFALWLIDKLRKEEKLRAVTDQTNSPTLNTNLAEMILEVVERRLTGIYHLAGATTISRYDYAKELAEVFNLKKELIEPATSEDIAWIAPRPKDSSLNVSKAAQTLENKPLNMREALIKLREDLL
jgi:dTDP-4-dehydrorhamnose reductase